MMKTLDELNGKLVEFGGVYEGTYEFKNYYDETEKANSTYVLLDGHCFEFREDPSDGYRSSCNVLGEVERPEGARFSLENMPVKLFLRYDTFTDKEEDWYRKQFEGVRLFKNEDDSAYVAQFGTDNSNDYYPSFTSYVDVKKLNHTNQRRIDERDE